MLPFWLPDPAAGYASDLVPDNTVFLSSMLGIMAASAFWLQRSGANRSHHRSAVRVSGCQPRSCPHELQRPGSKDPNHGAPHPFSTLG